MAERDRDQMPTLLLIHKDTYNNTANDGRQTVSLEVFNIVILQSIIRKNMLIQNQKNWISSDSF